MTHTLVSSDALVGLVAAGPVSDADLLLLKTRVSQFVAADGGVSHLLDAGLVPEAVVGDFDSIGARHNELPADIVHQVAEQESTDFEKCLTRIDAPLVLAVGVVGGRVDHLLAVLNTLVRHVGQRCIVIGPEDITFLAPPHLTLATEAGTTVSLFPLATVSAESKGLEWPLQGIPFEPDGRIGTSNVATSAVELRCDLPGLLVTLPRDCLDLAISGLQLAPVWPKP